MTTAVAIPPTNNLKYEIATDTKEEATSNLFVAKHLNPAYDESIRRFGDAIFPRFKAPKLVLAPPIHSADEEATRFRNRLSFFQDLNEWRNLSNILPAIAEALNLQVDKTWIDKTLRSPGPPKSIKDMIIEVAKEIQKHAKELAQIRQLSLSRLGITAIPQVLDSLNLSILNLYILNLANNRLTQLPNFVRIWPELSHLELQNNQLQFLPPDFGDCFPHLGILVLSYNRLKSLPTGLFKLKKLMVLRLNDNDLSSFPSNYRTIWPNLQTLRLENNKFSLLQLYFQAYKPLLKRIAYAALIAALGAFASRLTNWKFAVAGCAAYLGVHKYMENLKTIPLIPKMLNVRLKRLFIHIRRASFPSEKTAAFINDG